MSTTPAVRESGGDIEQRTPSQEIVAGIRSDTFREQIAKALPEGVDIDRFERATVTALLANPDIAKGDRDSLFQAVIRSAQDGLVPDGREAALVMFGQKVTYMPMIGGYRKIAAEYGWLIRAHVVYANDEYEYELGLDEKLTHKPPRPGVERGDRIAAYAIGVHRDGRKVFWPMSADDIDACRKVSRTASRGPWVEWTDRMWEKTAGRRLFERLPLDPADRERIDRVLAAELALGEAANMLYGTDAGISDPAIEASPGALTPTVTGSPTEPEDGSQQAEAEGTAQGDQPAGADGPSAPAPGEADVIEALDDEFGESEEIGEADVIRASAAAEHVVALAPNAKIKWPNGLTLAQIHQRGDDGVTFFRWALTKGGVELKAAAAAFAKVHLPFLHDELVGGQS